MAQQQLTMYQKLQILNTIRPDPVCICDNCKKEILISLQKEQVKLYNRGKEIIVDHTYFVCPECNWKHIAFLVDDEIRELQRRQGLRNKTYGPSEFLETKFKAHFKYLRNLYAEQKTNTSGD